MSLKEPKPLITTEQEHLINLARKLDLDGFADELEQQFFTPKLFNTMPFEKRLEHCLNAQDQMVSTRKFNNMFRSSKIKNKLSINCFKPEPARGIDAPLLKILLDCKYIQNGNNIIFSGKTGTGKTALSSAAGVEAMKKGYSTMFFRMNDLVTIIESKDKLALSRFKDRLRRIKLLILDDYGLSMYSDVVLSFLNDLANERYGLGSTIFTTQLTIESMLAPFSESPTRDAFADRMFRSTDMKFTLIGESFRGTVGELMGEQ